MNETSRVCSRSSDQSLVLWMGIYWEMVSSSGSGCLQWLLQHLYPIEVADNPEQQKVGDLPPDSPTSSPEYPKEKIEQKPKEFVVHTQERPQCLAAVNGRDRSAVYALMDQISECELVSNYYLLSVYTWTTGDVILTTCFPHGWPYLVNGWEDVGHIIIFIIMIVALFQFDWLL